MATGQVGVFTLTSPFSSPAPATPASQLSNFAQVVGASVQGTVGIIQALKQPTVMYSPAIAGSIPGVPGAGAAQIQTNAAPAAGSSFALWAIAGAGLALVAALGIAIARR